MKSFIKSEKFPFLLFFIVGLFALTWFHGKQFILAGDLGWPVNFEIFFNFTQNIWDTSVAPGYSAPRQLASLFPHALYGYLASLLGITASVFQKIVFVVSFFASGYGMYLLAKKLKLERLPAVISGLTYMLSPYALVVAWNPSYGLIFSFFAFIPLICYFFINYIESEKVLGRELAILILAITFSTISFSFSNPAYVILLFVFLLLFLVYFLVSKNIQNPIAKFFTVAFFTFLTQAFWIIPLVLKPDFTNAANEAMGLVTDYETQYINTVTFRDSLRGLGLWTMFGGHNDYSYYYSFKSLWENPSYLLFSSLPILFAAHLLIEKKNLKLILLMFALLLAIAFNSGLKAPSFFENFIEIAYKMPILSRVFRSVYLKLGILIAFPLSILVGKFFERIGSKHRVFTFTYLALLIIFSYPFFNGEIIRKNDDVFPGYSFDIPQDYLEVGEVLNSDPQYGKVFMYPIPDGYNYHLRWENDGFAGSDFMRYIIRRPIFYIGSMPLIKEFSETYDINILRKLSVKYIIVRKDVIEEIKGSYLVNDDVMFKENILSSTQLNKVLETENLILYKFENDFIFPKFYTVSGDNTFAKSALYETLENSKFKVRIDEGERLVYSEKYDPDWITSLRTKNELFNGYSSSWEIPSNFKGNIIVEFKPQRYFEFGLMLSVLALGFTAYLYVKK